LPLATRLMPALGAGTPAEVGPLLSNDLQQAAISLRPELRRTLAAGIEHGALAAIVSGSGPTCAYLARDSRHAAALAVALAGAGVCRTVVHVVGPVPGAGVTSIGAEPVCAREYQVVSGRSMPSRAVARRDGSPGGGGAHSGAIGDGDNAASPRPPPHPPFMAVRAAGWMIYGACPSQ